MTKPAPMTELEERIIELAKDDPARLLLLMGEHGRVQLMVCLLRQDGYSQLRVARRLSLTKRQVQHKKCGAC